MTNIEQVDPEHFFNRVETRAREHGFTPDSGLNGNLSFWCDGRVVVLETGENDPAEVRFTVLDFDVPEDADPLVVGWWATTDLQMHTVMRAMGRALDFA